MYNGVWSKTRARAFYAEVLTHATGAAARGVRVRPAAPSATRTQINLLGPSVLGQPGQLRLVPFDAFNNPITVGREGVRVKNRIV